MKSQVLKKSLFIALFCLALSVFYIDSSWAQSEGGYPNDETIIVGNDIREGNEVLYSLNLQIPEAVRPNEVFEVRLSVEYGALESFTSSAKILVTGADLMNEQLQELEPDGVWQVKAQSSGTIGVVIETEAQVNETSTIYIDRLEQKVLIASHESKNINTDETSTSGALLSSEGSWVKTALIAVCVFVGGAIIAASMKRRA